MAHKRRNMQGRKAVPSILLGEIDIGPDFGEGVNDADVASSGCGVEDGEALEGFVDTSIDRTKFWGGYGHGGFGWLGVVSPINVSVAVVTAGYLQFQILEKVPDQGIVSQKRNSVQQTWIAIVECHNTTTLLSDIPGY